MTKDAIYSLLGIVGCLFYIFVSVGFAISFIEDNLITKNKGIKKCVLIFLFILFLPVTLIYKILTISIEIIDIVINYFED